MGFSSNSILLDIRCDSSSDTIWIIHYDSDLVNFFGSLLIKYFFLQEEIPPVVIVTFTHSKIVLV